MVKLPAGTGARALIRALPFGYPSLRNVVTSYAAKAVAAIGLLVMSWKSASLFARIQWIDG